MVDDGMVESAETASGPHVECVIPTHDRDDFLRRALDSVDEQTHRNISITVVDDLSRPQTKNLVNEWAKSKPYRVRYVSIGPDEPSAGTSRNAGVVGTEAPYLAFLDDDDRWDTTFLEKCLVRLDQNMADISIAWTRHVSPSGEATPGLRITSGLDSSDVVGHNPGLTGSNFAIRAECFRRVGGFDPELPVANDLDFLVRALAAGARYAVIEEELVDQVGHTLGQLTTPSERRAAGLEKYMAKHQDRMSSADIRAMRRVIHSIRRVTSPTRVGRIRHGALQLGCSAPDDVIRAARNALSRERSIYHSGASPETPRRPEGPPTLHVYNFGLFGDFPGGMAQVVNRYLEWDFDNVEVRGVRTTRFRRDPLAPVLTFIALLRLFWIAIRRRERAVIAVHLSERGSFVREGAVVVTAHALRVPVVAHLHGAEFIEFENRHRAVVRSILSRASAVAALTSEAVTVATKHCDRVARIANGVNIPESAPERKDQRLLFGGEISRRKGADTLLEAWAKVAPNFPQWELELAGPVADEFLQHSSIERVTFLGPLSHHRLQDRLAGAAVAILPSRNEALPMFLLEAMSHSCVLISTEVGEISSIVSAVNGVLVEPGSVPDLARAIVETLSRPQDELMKMGSESRAIAEVRYSGPVVMSQLESLWFAALRDADIFTGAPR